MSKERRTRPKQTSADLLRFVLSVKLRKPRGELKLKVSIPLVWCFSLSEPHSVLFSQGRGSRGKEESTACKTHDLIRVRSFYRIDVFFMNCTVTIRTEFYKVDMNLYYYIEASLIAYHLTLSSCLLSLSHFLHNAPPLIHRPRIRKPPFSDPVPNPIHQL